MRLGIVGGRLQGTEAAYLGAEAGYEVVLVDRAAGVPGAGLAAEVHILDVTADEGASRAILETCDVVLPCCENLATLRWLDERLPLWGIPYAFHMPSYTLSSSKLRSNRLLAALDVPRPLPWPECGFPVVVKPSGASGSEGVRRASDPEALESARGALEAQGHEVVVQEFVDGPSLSLEVMSDGRRAKVLLPTSLEFDETYDCKRVTAPVEAPSALLEAFAAAGRRIAEGLGLWGIMDIEVMVDGLEPKVIEIDARLPSQTPTCVYHSCGVNMVEVLCRLAVDRRLPDIALGFRAACVYQHVRVGGGAVQVLGEHVMAGAGPLRKREGFFGVDVALTDYVPGATGWVATLVTLGPDVGSAREAAADAVERIARDGGLTLLPESVPRVGVEW
ncbi:MAG: 3-methylornithine--L-lysine ligase PylC [Thermoleophilia bacterium]